MRILVVCHRFPYPPKRGGKIRPFNIIRHWHAQGHKVHVASLSRSAEETAEISGISDHCTEYTVEELADVLAWAHMLLRLPTPIPSSMGYFYSGRLKATIDRWLDNYEFDLIFVHCSSVAQYVENVTKVPKIIDFGDMDSQKWQIYSKFKPFPFSLGYLWEGLKLEREEKRLASCFDMSTCTTRSELETLQSYSKAPATGWFPNGVDTDFFAPSDMGYDPNLVTFIGRMDYYPNQRAMLRFCAEVLPRVQAALPDARLQIVGADPSPEILRLSELPGVAVTGSVSDIRPFALQGALSVAPLDIARGTQNKILESMAMGVPVVCTTIAARGVDAEPGEHLLTADEPDDFACAVLRLMQHADTRQRFAEAGRARVVSNHSWQSALVRLDALVASCLRGSQRPPGTATAPPR